LEVIRLHDVEGHEPILSQSGDSRGGKPSHFGRTVSDTGAGQAAGEPSVAPVCHVTSATVYRTPERPEVSDTPARMSG